MSSGLSVLQRHVLACLFEPRSLVVVGDASFIDKVALPSALQEKPRFLAINASQSLSLRRWQRVKKSLELQADRLDLAVVCLPEDKVAQAFEGLATLRPRCVLVLRHQQPVVDYPRLVQFCRAWSQKHRCYLLGPESFGLLQPYRGLRLAINQTPTPSGKVAVIAQSTALLAALLDWARDIELGFATVIAVNTDSTLDVSQVLNYLAMDDHCDSIVLHLEQPQSSRRFASALHAATRVKPVIVLQAGRFPADHGAAAQLQAKIDTAALDALLRRVGAIRVQQFIHLFAALKALEHKNRPQGRHIAVITNGQAIAKLTLDAMGPSSEVHPAVLHENSCKTLIKKVGVYAAAKNPIIIHAPLTTALVQRTIDVCLSDQAVDGVLVAFSPDTYVDFKEIVACLIDVSKAAKKLIFTCLIGDASMRSLRHRLDAAGVPAFRTPENAVEAFGYLASYYYSQRLALQTLPPQPFIFLPAVSQARALIQTAVDAGQQWLTAAQAQQVFQAFAVPIALGVGRQTLDHLTLPALSIYFAQDSAYGPYIAFGASGQIEWEAYSSRAVELPPLNHFLAQQKIGRASLWPKILALKLPEQQLALLYEALERLSDVVCDCAQVLEIHLDPLWLTADALISETLNIRVGAPEFEAAAAGSRYRHLTIHPYPRHWVHVNSFADGQEWIMRPIRPEDAQALQAFIRNLSPESRYMRFVSMLSELSPQILARFTSIVYDRELAFVAIVAASGSEAGEKIIGFCHYLRHECGQVAEYALAVADGWQRRGLGRCLLQQLIAAAKTQRLRYIDGYILRHNYAMLTLMRRLGFQNDPDPDDPGNRRVWRVLDDARE